MSVRRKHKLTEIIMLLYDVMMMFCEVLTHPAQHPTGTVSLSPSYFQCSPPLYSQQQRKEDDPKTQIKTKLIIKPTDENTGVHRRW